MSDLVELEHELGPQLRHAFDTIIRTDPARFGGPVVAGQQGGPRRGGAAVDVPMSSVRIVSVDRRRRVAGIAAAVLATAGLGGILVIGDRETGSAPGVAPTNPTFAIDADSNAATSPSVTGEPGSTQPITFSDTTDSIPDFRGLARRVPPNR